MDGAPKAGSGGRKATAPPVPAARDADNAGAAQVPRRAPLPEDTAAAAADDAPAAALAGGSGSGGGGGEEEDDEQVERFYALLDNIRAMRGAYGAGDSHGGDGTGADGVVAGGGGGGARKRERAADPPWRPAFRLEDFEEPSPTSSPPDDAGPLAKRAHGQEEVGAGEGGARAAVAPASPPPPPQQPRRAGVRLDIGRKSI